MVVGGVGLGCSDGAEPTQPGAGRDPSEQMLPERPFLLVVNKRESTLSAIDLRTGMEAARVRTGHRPHEVAVTRDGRTAWVTDYGSLERPGNTLTGVDLEEFRVTGTMSLGTHSRPHGIAVGPDGALWVTAEGSEHLLQIDLAAGLLRRAIPTGGQGTHMVAVSQDRVVTANIGSGDATLVEAADGHVLATVTTGAGAEGVDIHPDGSRAYVSNRAADTLVEIDLTAGRVTRELVVGAFPIRVKVRPGGAEALVSNAQADELAVVDLSTFQVVRRVPVGSAPIGVLVAPDDRTAYVASTAEDLITIVDLGTWTVTGRISTGREPDGLAWVP